VADSIIFDIRTIVSGSYLSLMRVDIEAVGVNRLFILFSIL